MKKLVSIFVPYYNDSAFLSECIESILNQSYENFELILLDHASTDNSSQIAHAYGDKRIKHIAMSKNLGAGGGMLVREFQKLAKGEYIKLFCADDVMLPYCIADFVEYMESNLDVDVVFGNVMYVNQHLESLKGDWFTHHKYFSLNDNECELLQKYKEGKSVLPYIGSFVRRDVFSEIMLEKTFIMVFDMSLWLAVLLKNRHVSFLNKIIAKYRIHGNQESSAKKSKLIAERSFYESIAYTDLFYSYIKDVRTLKRVFPESPFIGKMTDLDTNLIEFVIANAFFLGEQKAFKINAYLRIEKMLNDDDMREKIEMKFGYGIADFRKVYSQVPSLSFKKTLYRKQPDHLSLLDICFLLFRELWNIISFRKIRKKKKFTL